MASYEQQVTLNPAEVRDVAFQVLEPVGVHQVNVDGLAGSFEVLLVPPNLLLNPSFELYDNGNPQNWYTWSEQVGTQFLTRQAGMGGGLAVGIVETIPLNSSNWSARTVLIDPAKSYYLSGWVSLEGVAGSGGVFIKAGWRNGAQVTLGTSSIVGTLGLKGTQGWTQYFGVLTPVPGSVYCLVYAQMYRVTGKALFDDFMFREAA